MSVEQSIIDKLNAALAPQNLEVSNDSHRHQGHAGSPGTGESHFSIRIVADGFSGKSRLDRHRMVNEALKAELAGPVHALAIVALSPEESASA